MREPVGRLARALGYAFSNDGLAERALTHRSAGADNNERLEFLGDAILGFIIAERLFERFPDADEGRLSRLRAKLVKRDALARLARELDLGAYLELGAGELRSGGRQRASIQADALEAVFGAIYLDGGYAATREVVSRLFEQPLAELSAVTQEKDPKTRLQELLQARGEPLPEYEITAVKGEQHEQTFTVACRLEALRLAATATGSSRRKAEQAAAQLVLDKIQ